MSIFSSLAFRPRPVDIYIILFAFTFVNNIFRKFSNFF
ncbi:hypothetical protein LEP1GSC005_1306 [Leptospira santarosai str. ST188]|nr:hypothetical protein LEP1GSC005_1306 [Leptospira santarosai str. ST188]